MVEANRSLLAREPIVTPIVFDSTLLVSDLAREFLRAHRRRHARERVDAFGELLTLVGVDTAERGAGRVDVLA